jgi:hypothetical protein
MYGLTLKKARTFIFTCFRVHLFFSPLFLILVLGDKRKGLELLRLIVSYKVHLALKCKYDSFVLKNIDNVADSNYKKVVWLFWNSGFDNAPFLVKRCNESVHSHFIGWKIIEVTEKNFSDYVEIPTYILVKWKKGVISNTHFSDILRICLLVRYGGLWLDSTVLCTSSSIPSYIVDSDLFFFQDLKPGFDGHSLIGSSWLISAKANNVILENVQRLLFIYWERNNSLIDYFLLHHFISIVCAANPRILSKIPKVPNSLSHILLLQLFDVYNEKTYSHIKSFVPFHKLSYKFDDSLLDARGTYYDEIIKKGNF